MPGKLISHIPANRAGLGIADPIGTEALVFGGAHRPSDHRHLPYPGMSPKRRLHFTKLDAISAYFHLGIASADKLDGSVLSLPTVVACPVPATTVGKRI